jgi:glycosyltransferase
MNSNYIKGLVSVVMPTYKRFDKLPRAIESVLNQTYSTLELLLVNDNDPDDKFTEYVKEISKKYLSDTRFKLILQDKHINGAVARNIAINHAKGEYIAFLDDDDWWEHNKLEEQVKTLSKLDNSWGGVSCKFKLYDINLNIIGKTRKYRDGYIYKDILFLQSDVATSTLLLRRSALDETGYFDEKLLRNQDLQLLVFFTYKYKLMEVDKYLHCVDVSDAQNRPSGDKAVSVVNNFFKSVKPILDTLTPSELRTVKAIRNIEIAFVYFKECRYMMAMRYFIKVLKSPKAFHLSILKLINRHKTFSIR